MSNPKDVYVDAKNVEFAQGISVQDAMDMTAFFALMKTAPMPLIAEAALRFGNLIKTAIDKTLDVYLETYHPNASRAELWPKDEIDAAKDQMDSIISERNK